MDLVIQPFVGAAEWCRRAGFDAVEIQMGHVCHPAGTMCVLNPPNERSLNQVRAWA